MTAGLPVPMARRMSRAELGDARRYGWHCEARGCRAAAAIRTGRHFRRHGRVLLADHFFCAAHGEAFATRYGVPVEPALDASDEPEATGGRS